MNKPRFYTLPPRGIYYPYLFVTPKSYKFLFKTKFEHAILDSGIGIFKRNPQLDDYPRGFLTHWKVLAQYLTKIFKEKLWIVIPDYPDDLNANHQFGDNIAKTIRNIKDFIVVKGVNWLPVIQSRFLDKSSFLLSCKLTKEIVGDYLRIAIGTICKTNNLNFIEFCCKTAREFFPNSWIHAFGLTLRALKSCKGLIDSFDSMSYTFPRESHRGSCKNTKERIEFFNKYLECVKQNMRRDMTLDLFVDL